MEIVISQTQAPQPSPLIYIYINIIKSRFGHRETDSGPVRRIRSEGSKGLLKQIMIEQNDILEVSAPNAILHIQRLNDIIGVVEDNDAQGARTFLGHPSPILHAPTPTCPVRATFVHFDMD